MERSAIHDRRAEAARADRFGPYGDLAKMLGRNVDNPHFSAQVGFISGETAADEVANRRPVLRAIVDSRDDTLPGEDEIQFAFRQIAVVREYWEVAESTPT